MNATLNASLRKPAHSVLSGFSAVWSNVAHVFASLAAATAVANAIENRRQPLEADLRQLGMAGAKFNLTY